MQYNVPMKVKLIEVDIAVRFRKKKKTFAIAESCTGGLVSHRITDVPGSSKYYLGGVVAYSNAVKISILGVSKELIKKHGAVSRQVAKAMAFGMRSLAGADIVAAVTGIAGPGGGNPEKPVGLAYIAVCSKKLSRTRKILVKGTRGEVKEQFSDKVMEAVKDFLTLAS